MMKSRYPAPAAGRTVAMDADDTVWNARVKDGSDSTVFPTEEQVQAAAAAIASEFASESWSELSSLDREGYGHEARAALKSCAALVNGIADQRDAVQRENENLIEMTVNDERRIMRMEERAETLREDLELANARRAELADSLMEMGKQRDAAKAEVERLRGEWQRDTATGWESTKQERRSLALAFGMDPEEALQLDFVACANSLRSELARAKNGARWLSERLESAVKREEKLAADLSAVRAELEAARRECREAQELITALNESEDGTERENDSLRAELASLREELAAARQDVDFAYHDGYKTGRHHAARSNVQIPEDAEERMAQASAELAYKNRLLYQSLCAINVLRREIDNEWRPGAVEIVAQRNAANERVSELAENEEQLIAELSALRTELAQQERQNQRLREQVEGEESTARVWLEERDLALADVDVLRRKVGEKSRQLLQRQIDEANRIAGYIPTNARGAAQQLINAIKPTVQHIWDRETADAIEELIGQQLPLFESWLSPVVPAAAEPSEENSVLCVCGHDADSHRDCTQSAECMRPDGCDCTMYRPFIAAAAVPVEPPAVDPDLGRTQQELRIYYRNHRGEHSWRRIQPIALRFCSTEWHPDEQWLLQAWDLDKAVIRSFALCDVLQIRDLRAAPAAPGVAPTARDEDETAEVVAAFEAGEKHVTQEPFGFGARVVHRSQPHRGVGVIGDVNLTSNGWPLGQRHVQWPPGNFYTWEKIDDLAPAPSEVHATPSLGEEERGFSTGDRVEYAGGDCGIGVVKEIDHGGLSCVLVEWPHITAWERPERLHLAAPPVVGEGADMAAASKLADVLARFKPGEIIESALAGDGNIALTDPIDFDEINTSRVPIPAFATSFLIYPELSSVRFEFGEAAAAEADPAVGVALPEPTEQEDYPKFCEHRVMLDEVEWSALDGKPTWTFVRYRDGCTLRPAPSVSPTEETKP